MGRKMGSMNKDSVELKIEIQKIKAKYNKITPDLVLKEAKNQKHPLHSYFDWDDDEAAIKWRRHQARMLLDSITQVVIIQGKETKQRSFFNVKERGTQESVYVTVEEAIKIKSYREQLLEQIINHLEKTTNLMRMFESTK